MTKNGCNNFHFLCIILLFVCGCATMPGYWKTISTPEEGGRQFVKITEKNDFLDTETMFDVSKDGKKIAFTSWKSGNGDIYVKYIAGGKAMLQRTFRNETEFNPGFSPDGKNLVFCAWRDGASKIYMIGAESGSSIRQITSSSPKFAENPAFSPDGRLVAFNSADYVLNKYGKYERAGNEFIWTYDLNNGLLSQYTAGIYPAFTPDGKSIVFKRAAQSENGYFGLWMIDLVTGAETNIISGEDFGIGTFSVSSDGEKIVFSTLKDTSGSGKEKKNLNLWLVDMNGSNLTQLTFHLSDDINPVWAPDMSGIYFLSSRGEENKRTMNIWRISYEK